MNQLELTTLMKQFIADYKSETEGIVATYVPSTIYKFRKVIPYEGVVGLVKFNAPGSEDNDFAAKIFWKKLNRIEEYYMIKIKRKVHGIDGPAYVYRPYMESLSEYFKIWQSDIGSRIERAGQELLVANHPLVQKGHSIVEKTLKKGTSSKESQLRISTIKELIEGDTIRREISQELSIDRFIVDYVIRDLLYQDPKLGPVVRRELADEAMRNLKNISL